MESSHSKNKDIEKKFSNTWYDWLTNYMPEHIKIDGGFLDKVV